MSQHTRSALALAAVLVAAISTEAQPCRPNPGGTPWETKIVYLKFEGCAAAEPKGPFDLEVGDETVRFSKTDKYWRGETDRPFVIRTRRLSFSLMTMRAQTACNVGAEEHEAGQCVALYRIKCEEVWRLNVKPVPEDAKATIRYDRPPIPPVFLPCAGALRTEGKGNLDLRNSEEITVNVEGVPDGPFKVPLSLRAFTLNQTVLRLRDVVPSGNVRDTAVGGSNAMRALQKGQIQKVLEDLLFTKQ